MKNINNYNQQRNIKTEDLTKKSKLTISEMAKIVGISRQTLIYYDKHNIFQPDYVNGKGYRLYSIQSIPYLREICFLKAIGIKLEDINTHVYNRTTENVFDFLNYHKNQIDNQIDELIRKRNSINNRMKVYSKAIEYKNKINAPFIQHLPERKICFFPWGSVNMNRTILHLTVMKSWVEMEKYGLFVENGWGSMLLSKNLKQGNILEGGGGYATLPSNTEVDEQMQGIITINEGDFACMYKYGMPYDKEFVYMLTDWIEKNNYVITGDIIDECILDTTFYEQNHKVDFCQLQIPVRKKYNSL